ncbi:jg22081 [Pararge aegeria aegeria]|uniref:Jg22081 protein n=1 Tax=Pararge aegeria aegeria TaxID=348720 RepID=A0A8S4RNC8_9NEOP|nr:jg22081 [Pararge aegeria aegeria]
MRRSVEELVTDIAIYRVAKLKWQWVGLITRERVNQIPSGRRTLQELVGDLEEILDRKGRFVILSSDSQLALYPEASEIIRTCEDPANKEDVITKKMWCVKLPYFRGDSAALPKLDTPPRCAAPCPRGSHRNGGNRVIAPDLCDIILTRATVSGQADVRHIPAVSFPPVYAGADVRLHLLHASAPRDNFFAKVNHGFPRPLAAQHGEYNAGQREVPAYFRYQSVTLRIPPATLLEIRNHPEKY